MNGTELLYEELCESEDCENTQEPLDTDNYVTYLPNNANLTVTAQRLKELRDQISGQVINVTFMDDFPLSYSSRENGSSKGFGVAFELLEFLTEKFNFTYDLVKPQRNIMGSSQQYNGSILELLETEVRDLK